MQLISKTTVPFFKSIILIVDIAPDKAEIKRAVLFLFNFFLSKSSRYSILERIIKSNVVVSLNI